MKTCLLFAGTCALHALPPQLPTFELHLTVSSLEPEQRDEFT